MKILFIGDLNSYARSRQRFLVLQDLGHSVEAISWVPTKQGLEPNYRNNLWVRIRRKIGYPVDLVGLNKKLLPAIADYKPHLLWIEKANTIYPNTYKTIKSNFPSLKIVYYSEDDIYVPNNRSAYLKQSLPIFDIVYTTKPRNLKELPNLGVKKVVCVYKAYATDFHRPLKITDSDRKLWGAKVSFVGTFEKDRARQILFLAEHGIEVRVWGENWQNWQSRHPNVLLESKGVYNNDFIKVINTTKINLNFLRKANRDKHTARSVEIPACEAFMLAERTDEHMELFEEGKEAEFFDSPTELLKKVEYYLSHEQERQRIAYAGRNRCINSGYSHHARLKEMLKHV